MNQKLTLEKVIGLTTQNNSGLSVNNSNGDIAYLAGRCVVVYSARRNRQVRFFRASKAVASCTFSSDGKYLAVGESGKEPAIIVFDTTTGAVLSELKAHKFGISCLAFSPSSSVLVSCGFKHDRRMYIWNWKGARPVAAARLSQQVNSLEFTGPKGFVTVGEKHVKFWNLDASNVIFPGQESNQNADQNESSVNEGELSVLAANLPNPDTPLPEIKGFPASILASHATSTFVDVACHKATSKIFTVTSNGQLCSFDGKEQVMENWVSLESQSGFSLDVCGDSIVIGCGRGVVRLFDAKTLKYVTSLPLPPTTSSVNSTTLPTPPTTSTTTTTAITLPSASCVRFLPGATKATVIYGDNSLFVYDLTNPSSIGKYRSFLHHSGPIWDLQCVPLKSNPIKTDGESSPASPRDSPDVPEYTFLTTSADKTFRFWNLGVPGTSRVVHNRWKNIYSKDLIHCEVHPADEENASFRSVAAHPKRQDMAVGDNKGRIMIFDINSLSFNKVVNAHDSEVMSLDYSPSGLMVSGSRDNLVHVFNSKYGRITTLDNHTETVNTVKFSGLGDKLVSCGSDKSMYISSVETSGGLTAVSKSSSVVLANTVYDICPSDKFFVSSQKSTLNVYSQGGKVKRKYGGEGGDIYKLDVDRSGLVVATAGMDKWVRLFDFMSGECIGKVAGHSELVTGVKFTLDNRRLISVGGDGCIFVWRLSPEITKAMEERLAEKAKAAAVARAAAVVSASEKQLKTEEVPGWAKTLKDAEEKRKEGVDATKALPAVPKDAWTKKKEKDSEVERAPSPPPPPPPEEEEGDADKYEDDFEFDEDAVVIEKGGAEGEGDELLRSSISVVAPDDENPNLSVIEDDEHVTDPSLFYASIDEGNMGGMFEKIGVKGGEMVRKDEDDDDDDDDLIEFGDETVDDSCYKEVMEDIADVEKQEERVGEVEESLSKDYRKMRSQSDSGDGEEDMDLEKLEQTLTEKEMSLREERELVKLKEEKKEGVSELMDKNKKKTANAVEQMREKLQAMGFLSADEINPKTINLDKEIGLLPKEKDIEPEVTEKVDGLVGLVEEANQKEEEEEEEEEEPPPPPPPLCVNTEFTTDQANGPATKDSSTMFLSPATTASSKSEDDTLIGLSFAQTSKKEGGADGGEVEEDKSVESDKTIPIQSKTSPSNCSGDMDKENSRVDENSQADVAEISKSNGGASGVQVNDSVCTEGGTLKRPKEVYKKTLSDLNAAMKNAFDLYQELLENSAVNVSSNTFVLDDSVATLEESEPVELLNSFRDSFNSLQGRMAVFSNTMKEKEEAGFRNSEKFGMPSILEDSTSSFNIMGGVGTSGGKPPLMSQSVSGGGAEFKKENAGLARPVTAPGGGRSGGEENREDRSEAELLDSVLEKHADLLFAKLAQRIDLSKTQELGE
ncbi:hypothetical protein TrVE_jg4264 [Triparma verrucosa]|uniref:Uncharacterized protein n=1 Tax=Triparma verrucosa TaxID=1606542 RepID=A0A9W7FJ31_9STRA|nr:hypothetical protein TrVE_jg4264 [Triparma verrucosa]